MNLQLPKAVMYQSYFTKSRSVYRVIINLDQGQGQSGHFSGTGLYVHSCRKVHTRKKYHTINGKQNKFFYPNLSRPCLLLCGCMRTERNLLCNTLRSQKTKVELQNMLNFDLLGSCFPRHIHTGNTLHSSPLSDPENMGERQKGVNFDTLGSWNNRLNMPIMVEQSIAKGKLIPRIPLQEVGSASLVGRRKVNEDRFTITELTPNISYFGIFDGHGGSLAVEFVHQHIESHMFYWLTRTKKLTEVLWNAFIDVNNALARHLTFYHLDTSFHTTGTTATVCLLRDNIELVVGHVGDSRAILCREGTAVRLTEDHDPQHPEEKIRIKNNKGKIVENSLGVRQVNGRLSMTRSIGDMDLKQYGVCAVPYIRSIEVKHGKDAFLVLTTDGISFVLNDQELADIVGSCANPSEAASFITDQALQFGSEDNATSVVVPFGAWGKYRSTTRSIPYSFGRNLFSNRYA